jgi:soluble lytic murein transglycosylase-like protein
MRALLLAIFGTLTISLVCAQTTSDYLKLRGEQHIVQPTPSTKLETLAGPSIVEIQATVDGFEKVGSAVQLMVQLDDKSNLTVDCEGNPPDWLNNGQVPVRLLVRVSRAGEYEPLVAQLVSVAKEEDIAKVDDAYWRVEAQKAKTAKSQPAVQRPYNKASRGGGDVMYGWIGRGHRNEVFVPSSNAILAAYRNFILDRNRKLSLQVADQIAQSVISYSNGYHVDARLVMALIICESDFRPMSTSHSGAMGLGQLMPGTALWMGVHNPYDLRDNLYGTIKLLRTHMDQFHVDSYAVWSEDYVKALRLVLACYNAGEGAVRRHGGVPPFRETQNYVTNVIRTFQQLCG